jgi:phage tail-like protein
MTPERNIYWLLNAVGGWWPITKPTGISGVAPASDLTLDPLPGSATFLDKAFVRSIVCPVAVAGDSKGRVLVVDAATDRVTALDLTAKRAQRIAAFGGRGVDLRHFEAPCSLTVLPSGAIAVADAGNRRVQLFSGPPYVLLKVWAAPDVAMKPRAVASDRCGTVYIADGLSKTILRMRASGEWLPPVGGGELTDPVELAVGTDQTLAVVDGSCPNAHIVIFPSDGGKPVRLTLDGKPLVAKPLSVTFDGSCNLYVGTGNAIVAKLQPDTTQANGWSLRGEGVSDVDGSIAKLAWVKGSGLIGILKASTVGSAPQLFSMDTAGAYRRTGSFVIDSLDSKVETCSWHRVQILGTLPNGTSVSIMSATSEDRAAWTPDVRCVMVAGINPDCLIQSPPGRYLRLTFGLRSMGAATPQIHAIQVFWPRQSYLQYLPAVFQDDNESRLFLDRFLSIFQTTFDEFDGLLDNLWQLFDPLLTPDHVFPWLASWVALPLDPALTLAQQRQQLKSAPQTYTIRGTVAGLQNVIRIYTGVDNIRILEHFRLRNWTSLPGSGGLNEGARLWSPNFHGRLQVGVQSTVGSFQLTNEPSPASEPYSWGANQFSVLFPANPYTVSRDAAAIETVLDREKPAYTQAFLSPIFPRLRVGVQATLGVDAYVGKANAMILGKLATLNYDSVLAQSQAARDAEALGLSLSPRLGEDARIL